MVYSRIKPRFTIHNNLYKKYTYILVHKFTYGHKLFKDIRVYSHTSNVRGNNKEQLQMEI